MHINTFYVSKYHTVGLDYVGTFSRSKKKNRRKRQNEYLMTTHFAGLVQVLQ
jgi:hypothetical protein